MGPINAVKALYKNFANFNGRATRSEYWWALLYYMVVYAAQLYSTFAMTGSVGSAVSLVLSILLLGTFIPMISVSVRRLHDIDKSGWFYLLSFVPFVSIYVLYLFCQPSNRGNNSYGPDPRNRVADEPSTSKRQSKRPHAKRPQATASQAMGTAIPGTHTRVFM